MVEGLFGGLIVCKLDQQTFTSEFESHWVPHSYGCNIMAEGFRFIYLDFGFS